MSSPSAPGSAKSPGARHWPGLVMVAGGSVMLASKGVFAKFLYAHEVNFEAVVATRSVLAIPGFLLVAVLVGGIREGSQATTRDYLWAIVAGLSCYYAGSMMNFYALTLIDASVERALLFSYPSMVVMAGWAIGKSKPVPGAGPAVVATWLGIGLTVGLFQGSTFNANLEGAAYVLICSATIAFYFMLSERLTQRMGSARFTVTAMTAAGLAFALHYELRHGWQTLQLDPVAWGLMGGLVVFATVLPLYFVAEGLRRVGAVRGAVVSTLGPPAAAIMAALMLGERLTPLQLLGMFLIVLGILYLELSRRPS